MAYQVLARKCRPQRFSEIVGQEHITRTLQNAIRQQRVGHAYLFVGSRGIGKTTSARIFAKALNCEAGIVTEPCCKCQSCLEIAAGTSLDVIEIDGASHNKVEHIRDIRDNVQYTPARSRYKIYIIDEVHMLTTQAWNALLKTLEEPPPHVKFCFATTEPHKVLPTIVSRCQRFDLKRLSVKLIAGRLRDIAASEQIPIDDGAIVAIARAADGGMRDAQSIFDQIISFCGGPEAREITEADVIDVFGLASGRELATVAAAMLGNQPREVFATVNDLADRGRDLERFFSDLVFYFRNLMICQVCDNATDILDVSQTEMEELTAIAGQAPAATVQRMLEGLVSEEGRLKAALNKRVYLEVALARVMEGVHSVQIEDIIRRLNAIRASEGTPTAPAPPTAAAPTPIRLPERPAPAPAPAPKPIPTPAPAPAAAPAPVPPAAPAPAPTPLPAPKPAPTTAPPPVPTPIPTAVPVPVSATAASAAALPPPPAAAPTSTPAPAPVPAPAMVAADLPPAPAPPAPPPAKPATAEEIPPPWDETTPASAPPSDMEAYFDDQPLAAEPTYEPLLVGEDEDGLDGFSANFEADMGNLPVPPPLPADLPVIETEAELPLPIASEEEQMLAAEHWHQTLIDRLRSTPATAFLVAALDALRPVSYAGDTLELAYPEDMAKEQLAELQKPTTHRHLQKLLAELCGQAKLRLLLKAWVPGVSDTAKRRLVSSPEVLERVNQNPFVQQALNLFGGEIIDVRG